MSFVLASCTNIVNHPAQPSAQGGDYVIVNNTIQNNLQFYYSYTNNCDDKVLIATLNVNQNFTIHIPAGQTRWIFYCTYNDQICNDCRLFKIISSGSINPTTLSVPYDVSN